MANNGTDHDGGGLSPKSFHRWGDLGLSFSLLGGRKGDSASRAFRSGVANDGAASVGGEDAPHGIRVAARTRETGRERSVGVQRAGVIRSRIEGQGQRAALMSHRDVVVLLRAAVAGRSERVPRVGSVDPGLGRLVFRESGSPSPNRTLTGGGICYRRADRCRRLA